MKKKILNFALTLGLCFCFTFGAVVFTGCCDNSKANIKSKEVYALSAVSSVSFLNTLNTSRALSANPQAANAGIASVSAFNNKLQNSAYNSYGLSSNAVSAALTATQRPESITAEDVNGVSTCLKMFDNIIQGNGVDQTTVKNTETSEPLSLYTFVMTVSLPNADGGTETYKMYYNETESETNVEIDDEEEESETSTKLEGIMVYGENQYLVSGERNVETEGNETEISIEFTTKSQTNPENYIVVSQSIENDEVEYEYQIYVNDKKIQEIEIEFETEENKSSLKFHLKDKTTGVNQNTIFKIKKANNSNNFDVKIIKKSTNNTINVEIVEKAYKFTYDNGFVESIA